MNITIFKKIIKLCEEFKKQNCLIPSEYITENAINEDEEVIYNFLNFERHDKIFEEIVEHFIKYNEISIKIDMIRFKILFYLLIFSFDCENKGGIERIFVISNKITHANQVLLYYSDENNQILTARIACKYFENEYVRTNFVQPILNNNDEFERIFDYICEYEKSLHRRESTIPIEMNVNKKNFTIPTVPVNTPAEMERFHSKPIPKTTYRPDLKVQRNLWKEYQKNQCKAQELLEKAKTLPDFGKLTTPKEQEIYHKVQPFKPRRIPIKQHVSIKSNLTTVIREAALYSKEKESCIKEIDQIMKGGIDTELVRTLEKTIRVEEEKKQIEEIERKKLMCLLSHEEAIIAKCQVKTNNKMKYYETLKEREELRKQLMKWKEEERNLYKIKVEKAQESNKNAREAEKKIIEEKQTNARLIQWESKELLNKAMKEKEEELSRKMHIIQEIKAMHQVKKMNISKEFQKTEVSNLGLLCEMSIAELEERLLLIKMEASKELDQKRREISRKKEEKLKMVQDAKDFIMQYRSVKAKSEKKEIKVSEENAEIKELKRRIVEAKRIREACVVCPCKPCPIIIAHDRNK